MGSTGPGLQAFLPHALDSAGGTDIARTAEGYIEVIEMGVLNGNDGRPKDGTTYPGRMDSEKAVTHTIKEDDDGNEYIEPYDCDLLVRNWTVYEGWDDDCTVGEGCDAPLKDDEMDGWWAENSIVNCDPILDTWPSDDCAQADNDHPYWPGKSSTDQIGGGLFGGVAILNVAKGTMVSYNGRALQGFDIEEDGLHFYPGTIYPALASGDVTNAWVDAGGGATVYVDYASGIDAVSAVFMHDTIANTFVVEEDIAAATEWVLTFPTKRWYVDEEINDTAYSFYKPDEDDEAGCNGWSEGDTNPYQGYDQVNGVYGDEGETCTFAGWSPGDDWKPTSSLGTCDLPEYLGLNWEFCDVVKNTDTDTVAPFTSLWDGEACEEASLRLWDREESVFEEEFGFTPPVVSPAPPAPPGETEAPFELCYEVNVLRFGEGSVFGGDLIDDDAYGLTYSVSEIAPAAGWGRITLSGSDGKGKCVACDKDDDELHVDGAGLYGLPVTGFAAETYTNGFVADGVLANYGGLFDHKGSVNCNAEDSADDDCISDN
jgi:hypothetical protein